MKLSKSIILSPGRAAGDGAGSQVTLSSTLSRRLRANGSIKGGGGGGKSSPFFSKKRGSSFENPEPSSPKVTCIGQVRVKTKKKVKKQSRSLSRRHNGDGSFRKYEQGEDRPPSSIRYSSIGVPNCLPPAECASHRNQRWVHLPVSVCEALLAFRADFTCFKGSCFSNKDEIHDGSNEIGCGSVFSRWLVSLNDGEGGPQREIELVVGGGDEPEGEVRRSTRRHVFEDLEVKDGRIQVRGQCFVGEDETATVSISIPPKNALLLMRCRSNPMKMAALMNRLSWEAEAPTVDIEEEEEEESNKQEQQQMHCEYGDEKKEAILDMEVEEDEDEVESNMSSFEALLIQQNPEVCPNEEEVQEEDSVSTTPHSNSFPADEEIEETDTKLGTSNEENAQQTGTQITDSIEESKKDGGPSLPECLLLMMCEPKLSMEVSKETWVCSTDFIRWLPGRPQRPAKASKDDGCCHEQVKRRFSMDWKAKPTNSHTNAAAAPVPEKNDSLPPQPPPPKAPQQPARSSCSSLTANMIERKLASGVGEEPLVLKRCKSEPMRTAAAKLMPESCAMGKMEVEPHRRAAAGVGF